MSEKGEFKVIIVGAGFSGLCMAIQLKRNGIDDFVIIEKSDHVGGTWWENKYPGAECDVESHLYSFSFEPNPNWSRVFSCSDEIQAYMENTAKKYDIIKHIHFKEVVTENFFEKDNRWRVKTDKGEYRGQFLVFSSSPLHYANFPDIPGIRDFKGAVLHTSKWDRSFSFAGKRVGMIGCAASGIQAVPFLQEQSKELIIYQRTPQWIMIKGNRNFFWIEKLLFRLFPCLLKAYRWAIDFYHETMWNGFFKGSWIGPFFSKYVCQNYIRFSISSPELQKKLIPSYPIGCKRILLSDNFYYHLNKPNVTFLNDVTKMTANSMITKEGKEYPIDTLVLATGFDITGGIQHVKFQDHSKTVTKDDEDEEVFPDDEQFYGIYLPKQKNLFTLLGYNSVSTYTSVILYIESQVNHIIDVMKYMEKQKKSTIMVNPFIFKQFNQDLQKKSKLLVYDQCRNWYVRGEKNISIYPESVTIFTKNLQTMNFEESFLFN